jgi:hypothetical protein
VAQDGVAWSPVPEGRLAFRPRLVSGASKGSAAGSPQAHGGGKKGESIS